MLFICGNVDGNVGIIIHKIGSHLNDLKATNKIGNISIGIPFHNKNSYGCLIAILNFMASNITNQFITVLFFFKAKINAAKNHIFLSSSSKKIECAA